MGRTNSDLPKGFTLIELLMAMAITGLVSTGIYGVYSSQARTYMAQEQVVDLQQGLRLAMTLIPREVRMVGLSTVGGPDAGFTTADVTEMSFSLDRNLDGDIDDASEIITYKQVDEKLLRVRENDDTTKTVAENIEKVEFYYRTEGASPGWLTPVPATSHADIRAVTITLLAITSEKVSNNSGPTTFTTPAGTIWGPFSDGYRRRTLSTTVRCRNMGL